jgi:hypothetical protein
MLWARPASSLPAGTRRGLSSCSTAVAQFVLDGNDQVTRLVLEQTESEAFYELQR